MFAFDYVNICVHGNCSLITFMENFNVYRFFPFLRRLFFKTAGRFSQNSKQFLYYVKIKVHK